MEENIIDNTKKSKKKVKVEDKPKENLKPEELNVIVENLRKTFLELDVINIDDSKDYEDKIKKYFKILSRKEKVNKTMNLTEKDIDNICDKLLDIFDNTNKNRRKQVYENIFSKKNITELAVIDFIKNDMINNNNNYDMFDIYDVLGSNHPILVLLEKIRDNISNEVEKYKESK